MSPFRKDKLCNYNGKQFKILIISKTYKSRYLTKILLFVVSYLLWLIVFFSFSYGYKKDLRICGPSVLKGQCKSSRGASTDFQSSDF